MSKQIVYIPTEKYESFSVEYKLEEGSYAFVKQVEGYFFTPEELKQLLKEYTNKIVNEVGLVETTSEELNSKDYQPFITDEDDKLWTINKEHILSQLPKFLKEKGL
jgi:cytochrome c-type biogenesis protein CcmE